MRPVPRELIFVTSFYGALLLVVLKFRAWRPQFRRYWTAPFFPNNKLGLFFAAGFFLTAFWIWLLCSSPASATGDPRWRGGYSPAEQKELTK
jgi:hypothetical protein